MTWLLEGGDVSRARATILCIDDHWNGLMGCKMMLEENGYKVFAATGGDDGLRLFLSQAVDAVVLDYQMPGMNGDVIAAEMKRINSHVPIILLSAYATLPLEQAEFGGHVLVQVPTAQHSLVYASGLASRPIQNVLQTLARFMEESNSRGDTVKGMMRYLWQRWQHRIQNTKSAVGRY